MALLKIVIIIIILLLSPLSASATWLNQTVVDGAFLVNGNNQTFTSPTSGYINKIILNASSSAPPDTLTVSVYNTTSGTLLGSSSVSIGGTPAIDYTFTYSNIAVVSGGQYNYTLTDASGQISGRHTTTNPYSGGRLSTAVTDDMYFRIYIIDLGIVGNWTLDQGTGVYANDSSGFNNNGTITNAAWTTDSVNGTALSFDGSGDYVEIPASSDSINITNGGLTIEGWYKIEDLSHANTIFSKTVGGTYNTQYQVYHEGSAGNNIIVFRTVKGGVLKDIYSTGGAVNNTWAYIQAIWNGSTMFMYINGVLQGTNSVASPIDGGNGVSYIGELGIGDYIMEGKLDEIKIYNYALSSSELSTDYQAFQPVPAYPTGGMTISATYPPQTTTINFSWHDTEYMADELIVARDSSFNLIVVDTFTSNDYYSANLDSGQTYYWKVRQYNGTTGTYGDTSQVENFTIGTVSGASGQGIQGVVYEKVAGVTTPIDQATVFIYNSTWSTTQITGSNGYYLFQNLENGTYNLIASKRDYVTSNINFVTVNQTMQTHDIFLVKCTAPETCNWGSHYVKFIVQNWFGNVKYQYITANVFKGTEASASMSGITGTDGTVSFLLTKDQQYTLTFTNASQGVSESVTITASDTLYYIIVTDNELPWWTNQSYSAVDVVTFSVSTNAVNASFAWVNVSYNDTLGQTTALTFYLNQTNHSGTNNTQAILKSFTASSFSNNSHGFLVPSYQGQSYIVSVKATHTTFGSIYRSFGVHFQGTATTVDDFIPAQLKAILAIGFMLFIGGIFGEVRAAQGSLIFCGLGWLFFFWDWFNWFGATIENSIGVGLVLGSVVTIMWLMNERKKVEDIT